MSDQNNERRLTTRDEMTDFLLYTAPDGAVKVECILHDETIWLTQDRIAELFGVQRPAITKHLKNIFEAGELEEKVVSSILEHTTQHGAIEGKTQTRSAFFDYIERILENRTTFTMESFAESVNRFLEFNEYRILEGYGSISRKQAEDKAFKEYDKFNTTQRIESDFDKMIKQLPPAEGNRHFKYSMTGGKELGELWTELNEEIAKTTGRPYPINRKRTVVNTALKAFNDAFGELFKADSPEYILNHTKQKKYSSQDFWNAVEPELRRSDPQLVTDVEQYRDLVLNAFSHYSTEKHEIRTELTSAIQTIKDLKTALAN